MKGTAMKTQLAIVDDQKRLDAGDIDLDLTKLPPTVDIVTAARILGVGRTVAYELVREGVADAGDPRRPQDPGAHRTAPGNGRHPAIHVKGAAGSWAAPFVPYSSSSWSLTAARSPAAASPSTIRWY